ncbi:hypothetical protein FHX69_2607 [Prauserella muralis]|nr:hypothetical protein FHX69_2607 [Prauserella muralis]
MTRAVPGLRASAEDYNVALDNLDDHETRLSAVEAGGAAITMAGFLDLDPNVSGFKPAATNTYEVYSTGGATYIRFPNPGRQVSVTGDAKAHAYANTQGAGIRGGLKVDISFDNGASWETSAASPLAGTAGGTSAAERTCFVAAQYCRKGVPTGDVLVRVLGYREGDASLFRATLSAMMLGGDGTTTG